MVKCQNLTLNDHLSSGNLRATDPNDAGSRRDLSTRGRRSALRSIYGRLNKCQNLAPSDQVSFSNESGSFA